MSRDSSRFSTVLAVAGALLVAAGIWLYVNQRREPAASGPAVDLTQPVPFDAAITKATLPNGLRYIVKANQHPEKRAELRLVVDAGSVLEDDDQRGMAHFVEHMAFNGTERFPKLQIGEFMESIGMRYGPGINASTTFDETVYRLQVPTDRPELLARALTILEDWAHRVTFADQEIERERPVILEEWRLRRNVAARLQEQQAPALLAGTPYAARAPIGTPESIRTGSAERLRQFYRDWYRPDLMTVVAVGDFDQQAVAAAIAQQFGAIPAATAPRPRPASATPPAAETAVVVAQDPEATSTIVSIADRRARAEPSTTGEYRASLIDRIAIGMLSNRIAEVAQSPTGPLVSGAATRSRLVRPLEIIALTAAARGGAAVAGLQAIAHERARLLRFGFTQPELDRQKTMVMRGMEHAIAEKARQVSATLAAEYVRHATVGEAVPGLEWEHDVTARLLQGIGLGDVNEAIAQLIGPRPHMVAASAPARAGGPPLTQAAIEQGLAEAAAAPLEPWRPRVSAATLLESEPEPGAIVTSETREDIGLTELTLSNGARVVLLPTTFKDDQIIFTAVSPGGVSIAADDRLVPAQTAGQVVNSMGFGRFSSGDLRRWLAGRTVGAQPVIGPFEEGLSGAASRQELDTLFQLIHLMMTSPRRDQTIFDAVRSQMRDALANQAASPDVAFTRELSDALSQGHPRTRPVTAESTLAMDMDASLDFYKGRYGDAGDFTFVFVGSFDVDAIRPLVERYLASLPTRRQPESWVDPGVRPPTGIVRRTVQRGTEPRSRTAMVFTKLTQPDRARAVAIVAVAEILETRLRARLREELGGTYAVNVGGNLARVPVAQSTISVDFTSDPARAAGLAAQVLAEVERLRAAGPTSREVDDIRAKLLRDFETNSHQNQYLAGQIAQRYMSGEPIDTIWQMPAVYRTLTVAMLHDTARAHLDPANYVQVVLTPQQK